MAVVLALIATGLYLRFESQLDETINQGLRARAGDVARLADRPAGALGDARRRLVDRDESFAQILELDGTVYDASPSLRGRPLLTAAEVRDAARRRQTILARPNPSRPRPPGCSRPRSAPRAGACSSSSAPTPTIATQRCATSCSCS